MINDLSSKKSKILRAIWLGVIGLVAVYIFYMIFIGDRLRQQREARQAPQTEEVVTE